MYDKIIVLSFLIENFILINKISIHSFLTINFILVIIYYY